MTDLAELKKLLDKAELFKGRADDAGMLARQILLVLPSAERKKRLRKALEDLINSAESLAETTNNSLADDSIEQARRALEEK